MMKTFFQFPVESKELLSQLSERLPSWRIEYHLEHPSTQILAKESFRSGFRDKAVFITRNQTSGKGRHKRKWMSSPDGKDLTMTVLIPVQGEILKTSMMNLVAGISVVESLYVLTGYDFKIKWPNDVYYEDLKICGVLSELLTDEEGTCIAIGIGINVNSMPDDFDTEGFMNPIGTVCSVTGRECDLSGLVSEIIFTIDKNRILVQNDSGAVLKKWRQYGWRMNLKIRYREIDGDWQSGIIAGITKEGYLIINDENGWLKTELIEGDIISFDI